MDIDKPDIDLPDFELPNIGLSNVDVPDIGLPDVDLPEIGLSDRTLPDMDVPDIDPSSVSRRGVLGVLGVGAGGVGGVAVLANRNDSVPTSQNDAGSTVHDGSGPATVELTADHTFEPASLTIDVGTTVVWENVGSTGHSVTASEAELPDGAAYFTSSRVGSEEAARNTYPSKGKIRTDETFEHTFQTAGTYEYFCIQHEDDGMTGTIEVV